MIPHRHTTTTALLPKLLCAGLLLMTGISSCADHPCDADDGEECGQILVNPGFEITDGTTQRPGYEGRAMTGVEGWSNGPGAPRLNSPDIFDSPQDVPKNFMGSRTPLEGEKYAGISQGNNRDVYYNESLMGTLVPRHADGTTRTYRITGWFSTGSTRPKPSNIEIVLLDSRTGRELTATRTTVPATMEWEEVTAKVTTSTAFDRLVIRGYFDAENRHAMSYLYADRMSVQECGTDPERYDR